MACWMWKVLGGAYLGFGLQYALLTPFVLELGVPIRWASIIWLGGPITGSSVCMGCFGGA